MLKCILGLLSLLIDVNATSNNVSLIYGKSLNNKNVSNQCTTFSVTAGTGCAWMCNYCANTLGTNNYYFTDGVCKYQTGGCEGSPQIGVQYTCCAN